MPIHTFADFKKKSTYNNNNNNNNNKYKKKKPNPPSNEVKNAPCTRCGRSTHLASSCTNKTHIDGSKIAKEEKYCRDCGTNISDAPKHHKQCYDCFKGIEKPVWEKLSRGEKRSERREFNDEGGDSRDGRKRRRWIDKEKEKKEKPKRTNNAFVDMFDWSRPSKSLEKSLKKNENEEGEEKDEESPMFAGRDVNREKLTKSYEQTELAWNEESKKRKLEEDMKPIVIDDDVVDEEKEKERKRKVERRRVMLERAKKRLLGFREPADEKDKKKKGIRAQKSGMRTRIRFGSRPCTSLRKGRARKIFKYLRTST